MNIVELLSIRDHILDRKLDIEYYESEYRKKKDVIYLSKIKIAKEDMAKYIERHKEIVREG